MRQKLRKFDAFKPKILTTAISMCTLGVHVCEVHLNCSMEACVIEVDAYNVHSHIQLLHITQLHSCIQLVKEVKEVTLCGLCTMFRFVNLTATVLPRLYILKIPFLSPQNLKDNIILCTNVSLQLQLMSVVITVTYIHGA